MSMIEANEMMERTAEIEKTFNYDGYQIVRREMFAHMREPAVTIRKDSITFNTACINGLEDAVYIQILINRKDHRLAIRKCEEDDKDSVRWCISKNDKRKSRKITGREFSSRVYQLMDWSDKCRYKILGHRITYNGEVLYVFELDFQDIFFEKKKTTRAKVVAGQADCDLTPEQVEERKREEEKMPMKPFYPDDWENSFGVPVDKHKNVSLGSAEEYRSFGDTDAGEAVT